eukprot:TRINITY_DN5107_c0_g1_i3.p1 TRINITY_DN5107_c0_g1~~TRINITY_DN5107_c0_g1_i3.p1  ORF type:complete len:551 (+),score=126.34 TRINITY_DN5107_c0_g1_i3:47-1699(+)
MSSEDNSAGPSSLSHKRKVRSAAEYNMCLLQERQSRSPLYFDPHTRTVQVVGSWSLRTNPADYFALTNANMPCVKESELGLATQKYISHITRHQGLELEAPVGTSPLLYYVSHDAPYPSPGQPPIICPPLPTIPNDTPPSKALIQTPDSGHDDAPTSTYSFVPGLGDIANRSKQWHFDSLNPFHVSLSHSRMASTLKPSSSSTSPIPLPLLQSHHHHHQHHGNYHPPSGKTRILPKGVGPGLCEYCLGSIKNPPNLSSSVATENDKSSLNFRSSDTTNIKCEDCSRIFHVVCYQLTKPVLDTIRKHGSWKCVDCKGCEKCQDHGYEEKLMICDACDRGFHTFCLTPPMARIPPGAWRCPECVHCIHCNAKASPRGWRLNYTTCEPCYMQYMRGKVCPVCDRVYRVVDGLPMVQCDECSKWVHTHCDNISNAQYERMSEDPTSSWTCPICRDPKLKAQAEKKDAERQAERERNEKKHAAKRQNKDATQNGKAVAEEEVEVEVEAEVSDEGEPEEAPANQRRARQKNRNKDKDSGAVNQSNILVSKRRRAGE